MADKYQSLLVWDGTDEDSECEKFKRYVEKNYKLQFESDKEFQKWSTQNFRTYWEAVWKYFDVIASKQYTQVFKKTGQGILDCEWFVDAKFNYAENILRIRNDNIALMYEDEEGNTDRVTFNELFEEVQLYAAAFRKHGLGVGDRVACQMSNRKEAIFACLATISIGALWGSAVPYFGAQAATNIINKMEPKFLIVVDRHLDGGKVYDILGQLPSMIDGTPSLEKVIVVPSRRETLSVNISHIKNSCFINDFLNTGKLGDGSVPPLLFEQLPASHPVFLSFTSGTTGIVKGAVHSAKVLLHSLANVSFVYDLKCGDVFLSYFPMGWIPILNFLSCLSRGATLFMYSGSLYHVKNNRSFWHIASECQSSFLTFIPCHIEKFEQMNLIPGPELSFDKLRLITIGSSPVKAQNIKFLLKYFPKKVFISNMYGATEYFGMVSGVYMKSPSYAGEIQLPALGIDIRCFNEKGESVIGEQGSLVIATPTPNLPSYLWKDTDNKILNSKYLSQFPGVWCQSDNCIINPITNGISIKGRCDDTFVQNGDRFGPEDIYFAIHGIEEIEDSICVAQYEPEKEERVVLFVKLKKRYEFSPALKSKIEQKIEDELFEDLVPKLILPIPDIPYSLNTKKTEGIVRKILAENKVPDMVNVRNRECLKYFCDIPEIMDYYK